LATTNLGEQLISFSYGQSAESILFNRLNYQLHTPGIYDGGVLSKVSSSTINITRFTAFLVDSPTAIGMRVQTTQDIALDVSDTSKPYVVVYFDWQNQFANYADIKTVAWSNIDTDYMMVVGIL